MSPNPQETADFVTFTEEIHKRKLHFLCSGCLVLNLGQVPIGFEIAAV